MKVNNAILLFLLFALLLYAPSSYAAQVTPAETVNLICDEFESQIKTLVNTKKYLEAIGATAKYEQALLSRYPTPAFELGLFQSEAHHLSFHSPFEGWIQEDLKDVPQWLPAMGFDVLIVLKGKVEDDTFTVFSYDMGKIKQRLGEEDARAELNDQELQMGAQMMAANFGVVKNQEFKMVGDHRILALEIGTPLMGPSVILVSLARGGRIYGFLLTSSAGDRSQNEKRLYDLIETVDFKYKPSDVTKIETARQKLTDRTDVAQLLHCVRELALVGEYGEASDELSILRLVIVGNIPKPTVEGDVARYPAYGIVLKNPNPEKWNLSIDMQGGIGALVLEDRFSVNPAGIYVGIINTVLVYGPQAIDITGENASEEEKKGFLSLGGRGGLMGMGGVVESERFRIFKGLFAYEGVGSINIPNTKAKILVTQKPGYIIMVMMFIEASNFDTRSTEYETLLDECLHIETR